MCETDYDCAARNFCWRKQIGADINQQVCLEQHSAPDFTEFYWDIAAYPEMNKESILSHGRFCQSGIAVLKQKTDPDTSATVNYAECVTVDESVKIVKSDGSESTAGAPFACSIDNGNPS